ncbi:MAG: hybrid sensor histidine kinase/response regulator [Cyanobacteria bacterium SBLK]|nr:hybrid sensor histidine kinase/response regulator [Cyanobacteria bacterium SBLK]
MNENKFTILAIEDERINRRIIQEVLESGGYRVLLAATGEIGLDIAKNELPDLILSDIMMPGLDGYKVVALLRDNHVTNAIPIIFLTAKASWEDLRRGMEVGVDDYLTKPFKAKELLNSVASRLERQAIYNRHIQQERQKVEELEKLNSITSHEFRTPLAVISSSVGILKSFSDKLSEEKKQKHLETIQIYVKHTTQLLDDILDINRVESGKININLESISVFEFCQTLIQELQISSDRHEILFSYRTREAQPIGEVKALLDKKILRQILMNLLSNAIKYSPEGGEVRLELTASDRQIEFQVRDSGIGIPKNEQATLFQSFNRASNVGTIQGTGLGLSIVKKCVELHGGQIRFMSEVGWGTIFIVTLPHRVPQKC